MKPTCQRLYGPEDLPSWQERVATLEKAVAKVKTELAAARQLETQALLNAIVKADTEEEKTALRQKHSSLQERKKELQDGLLELNESLTEAYEVVGNIQAAGKSVDTGMEAANESAGGSEVPGDEDWEVAGEAEVEGSYVNDQEEEEGAGSGKLPSDLPTYGKGDGDAKNAMSDAEAFIMRFEAKLKSGNVARKRWPVILVGQMNTTALIKKVSGWQDESWDSVKAKFLESQLSKQVAWYRRQKLATMLKKASQTIREFNQEFELAASYVDGLDEETLVLHYVNGLRGEQRFMERLQGAISMSRLSGVDVSLQRVLDLALVMEADDQMRSGGEKKSTTKECYWCGRAGHREKECRAKAAGKPRVSSSKSENGRDDGRGGRKQQESKSNGSGSSGQRSGGGKPWITCHGCGEKGHYKNECPKAGSQAKGESSGRVRQVAESSDEEQDATGNGKNASEKVVKQITTAESEDETESDLESDDEWLDGLASFDSDDELGGIGHVKKMQVAEAKQVAVEEQHRPEQYVTPCLLGGNQVFALVDSGATKSVVDVGFCKAHGLEVEPRRGALKGAFAGSRVERIGVTTQMLENGKNKFMVHLDVMELESDKLILGTDVFPKLGIQVVGLAYAWPGQKPDEQGEVVSEVERNELRLKAVQDEDVSEVEKQAVMDAWRDLVEENARIPEDAFCTYPGAVLHVNTGNAQPIFVQQYPLAKQLHPKISERVGEWLDKGWIQRSKPGNPWCFPLMAAPKKDGKGGMTAMRLCVDLRELNKIIRDEPYPIPKLQDLLMSNAGVQYFGTFDQADSYHQWRIAETSKGVVSFIWDGVQYEFVRACFGIKTMTSLFQRAMTEILEGLEVDIYIDDLLIKAATLEEFIAIGREVLRRLNKWNIRLRISKCVWVAAKLMHLGRVVGRSGFSPDPVKIREIEEWERPTTYKRLKSFNCLAGFYREHIKDFATIMAPLTAVQERKGRIVEWTDEMQEAFEGIKKAFRGDHLVLAYPDLTKKMELYVDASNVGMGAVLMQESGGVKRMICAISKAFRGPELKYSATKKELRAVVWALLRFEQLLLAGRFVLFTDHKALTFLLTQKHTNPMLERWMDSILRFDFEIQHIPGKENLIADSLSRQYDKWLMDIKDAAVEKGKVVRSIPELVLQDWVRRVSGAKVEEEQLMAEERGKKYVGENDREAMLHDVHEFGHFGLEKMYQKLWRDGYWWPTMRSDIAKFIEKCDPCLKFNVVQQGYHDPGSVDAVKPWDMIAIDLVVSMPKAMTGETCCLVVIDVFTRFVILRALESKSKECVGAALWKLFADFGVPKVIQSDNGGEFANSVVDAMKKAFGMQHRWVAAYSHLTNGIVERAIRTVSQMLKKEVKGSTSQWPQWIPITQMAVNMVVNATTGSVPFELMFGRKWNPIRDYSTETAKQVTEEDRDIFVQKQKWLVEKIYPAVVERNSKRKAASKKYQREKRKIMGELEPGVMVYALDPLRETKWDVVYEGPFQVVGMDDKKCYVLKDADGKYLGRHFALEHLKVAKGVGEQDQAFVIEKILDHRRTPTGMEYLVKWKGYSDGENSWEPQGNFNDWQKTQQYWKIHAAGPGELEKGHRKGRKG